MIKENHLYIAYSIQWYEGFPFEKIQVEKIDEKNKVISFITECPVRHLSCYINYFLKNFEEWK